MTKQAAKVFLNYVRDIAKEAGIPVDSGFGIINFEVIIQNSEIFEIKVEGRGTIRPTK